MMKIKKKKNAVFVVNNKRWINFSKMFKYQSGKNYKLFQILPNNSQSQIEYLLIFKSNYKIYIKLSRKDSQARLP